MNRLPTACLALTLGLSGAALAEGLVISTGKEGGGYFGIGNRLKEVMAEQNVAVEVMPSVGSMENLLRLDDAQSPVNIGLTQADALKSFLLENPDFEGRMLLLGEMGQECVFIVTGKDTGIDDDGDLQDKGNLISLQDPNSGVAVTWQYMTTLEPKFKNTQPAFVDTMETLLQLKNGGKNAQVKAAMLVQRPDARSPAMQVVLDNPKEFRFVPVTDWDLNDKLPDGSAVYTFEDVTIQKKSWGFDTTVDTICTRALMVANKDKLSAEERSRLSRVMLLAADRVKGQTQ